jgi:hypothetical protein
MIQRSIQIKVRDNQYELKIPNNGQLIDIESMKMLLAKGSYKSLMNGSQTISNITVLDTIDMIAMFTVLLPTLAKDLSVTSLLDLDIIDNQELLKIYRDQVATWIVEWQRVLADYLSNQDE